MWASLTSRCGSEEMQYLETKPADELLPMMLNSDPLVALRYLAELMLNGDHVKLRELLTNTQLRGHCALFEQNPMADARDWQHATLLMQQRSE
jgi:hypothetical protein